MLEEQYLGNLLHRFGSPLYIYDKKGIESNAKEFMDAFKSLIPNFKQYFAVKATPNKYILQLLQDCSMGFDCSSITELQLVETLDKPSDIIYTSNFTSVEDFEFVLKLQSTSKSNITINLDDTDCLDNLLTASVNTQLPLPNIISFRMNPLFGRSDSEVKSNVLGGADTKFGIPSTRIVEAYQKAQKCGFTNFGIHVMTGSCVLDINYFNDLVDVVFESISLIKSELNIKFTFVNLGGGIGIPYKPEQSPINIQLLAHNINYAIQVNKQKYNITNDIIIMMENGRYITGPFGFLISKCKSIKNGVNSIFYGLDACMANLMRPGMYGAYHKITVPRLVNSSSSTHFANVVGTLCENNDWFAKNRELPIGIKKEDIFVIHDAGAHGYSMGFQYNGKLRSAEVLVDENLNPMEIRKKETTCFN